MIRVTTLPSVTPSTRCSPSCSAGTAAALAFARACIALVKKRDRLSFPLGMINCVCVCVVACFFACLLVCLPLCLKDAHIRACTVYVIIVQNDRIGQNRIKPQASNII